MDCYGKISKRSFSSLLVFLLLLIILIMPSFSGVGTVAAWSYPKEPVKIPPIITIESPLQETYTTSNVTLNFSVNAPESWYREGVPDEYVKNVTYRVDANSPKLIWTNGQIYSNITPGEFTYNLFGLGKGLHTLIIDVTISSPYDIFSPGDPHGHFSKEEIWNSTKTISFNIETAGTTPTPAESSTPNPTPTPSVPEFPTVLAIAFLIMITVAFAVVVKKRISVN